MDLPQLIGHLLILDDQQHALDDDDDEPSVMEFDEVNGPFEAARKKAKEAARQKGKEEEEAVVGVLV